MNTNDPRLERDPQAFDPQASGPHGDAALQLQLRALRQESMPGNDLWPGIAARISQTAQEAVSPAADNVVPLRRSLAAELAPFALAASLVLAVGVAWQQRPDDATSASNAVAPVQREAEALTREYDAALLELHTAGSPVTPMGDTLRQLDASAAQIRTALRRDPNARFLLDRLRHTYEKRLELTQDGVLERPALS